jgi:undecaprenyl diphosphate synthase
MSEQRQEDYLQRLSDAAQVPRHVAVIMDGNGRWARKRGLPRIAGHRKGVERVRDMVSVCVERGVSHLTLFAFSSENWRRPGEEVRLLTELFAQALEREVAKLHQNGIRFRVIGEIEAFGAKIANAVREAEALTRDNTRLTLTIAANYGGRWDIAQACAAVARQCEEGKIRSTEITPETLAPHLALADAPEPDLFVRTGGEQRISNFLLWQLAYTELFFTPVLWPEFDRAQFDLALASYAGRQRRFGLTGEQVDAVRHA